ncbi:hypothetical protein L6164_001784 [Bauhinia variegata]|uniref:Uncharacterized protein n=1 Tax=Bauhinia variegata TaxID=167791 RepID=A0ACB9QBL9_BAUVA|nr:hypothetical protein L6164_001784 [Bauhinia variegata]
MRQRWGIKGRAVPPNPPDKYQLDPTSPLGNPYPNTGGEIIKQSKQTEAPLSCIARSLSTILCVGTTHQHNGSAISTIR